MNSTEPLAYGDRVRKTSSESEDLHKNGEEGTVVEPPAHLPEPLRREASEPDFPAAFIEWDSSPGVPVFTIKAKLEKL